MSAPAEMRRTADTTGYGSRSHPDTPPMPPRRRKVLTPAKRAPGPVAWPDHSRSTPTAMPASPATARRAAVSSSVTDPLGSDRNREDRSRRALQQVPADVAGPELAGGPSAPDAEHQHIRRGFLQHREDSSHRRAAPHPQDRGPLEHGEPAERVGNAARDRRRPEAVGVEPAGILREDAHGERLRPRRGDELRRG